MQDEDEEGTLSGARQPDPTGLAGCRVEGRLAIGEGTRVYRAVDVAAHRTVALKVLVPPLVDEPSVVERFLSAASSLVGLAHPHVAEVLRAGRDQSVPYCVLEYVEGEDLERRLARGGPLPLDAALRVAVDAMRALEAALGRGVLHGDVRPGHLLALATGGVKLTGFGLSPPFSTALGRTLTGSPAYLAPEAIQGADVDHRADLYALGCTLYELATGRPPYGFGGPDALVACHVHEPFPSLAASCPAASPEVEAVVARMIAKNPARRFAAFADAIAAAERALPGLRDAPAAAPAFVVEEGRQIGLREEIPEGDTFVGRVVGEGLALDDARVSRRHALVRRRGPYVEIHDLDSRNGVRVNHVEVKSRQLMHGDRVGIGDTILRVDAPGAVEGVPAQGSLRIPDSPLRGAFGDVEIAHVPARQTRAEGLWPCAEVVGLGARVHLLAKASPVLAATSGWSLDVARAVMQAAASAVHASRAVVVPVVDGAIAPDAARAGDAALTSTVLPALTRALPGQLSLSTTVRHERDETRAVLVAPVRRGGATIAFLVAVKDEGRFAEHALMLLEAAASLLSDRASQGIDGGGRVL